MKILNKEYKGSTWSNGKHPKVVVFDDMKNEDSGWLEHIGMGFLLIEVCDECENKKCKCKKDSVKIAKKYIKDENSNSKK